MSITVLTISVLVTRVRNSFEAKEKKKTAHLPIISEACIFSRNVDIWQISRAPYVLGFDIQTKDIKNIVS